MRLLFVRDQLLPYLKKVLITLKILEEAGYEAWLVGGFVRDTLLGKPSHDFDIATNALPKQSKNILAQKGFAVHETGIKHGTITAILMEYHF